VTFVDWDDMPRWRIIDKTLGLEMPEPPETYHTSAHLYTDLDIPTDVAGTLPSAERTRVGLSAEVEEDLGGRSRGTAARRGPARGDGAGRSRDRRGGSSRSTSPAQPVGPEAETTGQDEPRRRQRRRRRVGEVVAGETAMTAETVEAGVGRATETADGPVAGATPTVVEADGTTKPRRRRRRRGSGSGGAPTPTES
jgi:hypothetical protein